MWTVEPSNATNQQIWLEMDQTALGCSWYSDEKRCDIQGFKSGEYTITAHSSDNNSITSIATVTVLSLADVEKTMLTLDEPATVTISESGKFGLFSFTPTTSDKYYFRTSGVSNEVRLSLFASDWKQLTYVNSYNDSNLIWQMTGGETYYVKAQYSYPNYTGSFSLTAGINVPVQSISLNGLNGMQLYPGDWKDFTWTVEPSNATNQRIWLEVTDYSALGWDSYSNENEGTIYGYKSGEYIITAHSYDDESITATATVAILSLADVEKTTLTLDETATVTISESGEFKLFSFTPETSGKYFFKTNGVSSEVKLALFSSDWTQLTYDYLYNNSNLIWQMTGGETYYVKAQYSYPNYTGSFSLTAGINIPVQSISLNGLDGMQLYPGDWKEFSWTVEPSNATNQGIWFEVMDYSALSCSPYSNHPSNENRGSIYGYKSGEYTIIAHSYDDESISATATVTILSLADVDKTTLPLDETTTVTISESGEFKLFSFTPETSGKYFFKTNGGSSDVKLTLFSSNWTRLIETYSYNNSNLIWQMTGGETYYLKVQYSYPYSTGSFSLIAGINVPVRSINLNGLDGMQLYPDDWKEFTWTVEPSNATNQGIWFEVMDNSALSCSPYSNENRATIYGYKSGEYTITAHSSDSESITATATITVLSLADAEKTALTLNQTTTVNISEAGTSKMFSFTPAVSGNYFFEVGNVSSEAKLYLYDAEWTNLTSVYSYGGNRLFWQMTTGETYYLKAQYSNSTYTGSYDLIAGQSIPVTSISLVGLDGMQLYTGERKQFTWTVEPSNATDQRIATNFYSAGLGISPYSSENRGDIYGYENGVYTITVYSLDNPNITATATITVLSLADMETTALALDETTTVNISEAGTFKLFSFVPTVSQNYVFQTQGDNDTYGYLYDSAFNELTNNDDGGNGCNFLISYYLTANQTYYLKARMYSSNTTGSFELSLTGENSEWNPPTYTWSADNSSVTATRTLVSDPSNFETETVQTVRSLITAPTKTEAGSYDIFTSPFRNSAFTLQRITGFSIPALNSMNVLELPSSLATIESEAFENIAAEAVIVPNSCDIINSYAFSYCENLLYVSIPVGTSVAENAFVQCPNAVIGWR